MDCEANTFFGVMNAFRGLNVFSLLPLSRQEYMLMFLVFRHRKTNPEGCTVSTLTRLMRVPQPAVSRTLRGLENNGYIRREVCREDRRNTYVTRLPERQRYSVPISFWRNFTGVSRNDSRRKSPIS